jgi:hypothetical protein
VFHRIVRLRLLEGQALEVAFDDGVTVSLDVKPWIAQGGVWAALADPGVFQKVAIGPRGRFIEWPGEIEVCADSIWELARKQAV